jgi:hypothetical protein
MVEPVLGGYQKWEPIIEGSQAVMKYTYTFTVVPKRIHITGSSNIVTTVPKHPGVHYDIYNRISWWHSFSRFEVWTSVGKWSEMKNW